MDRDCEQNFKRLPPFSLHYLGLSSLGDTQSLMWPFPPLESGFLVLNSLMDFGGILAKMFHLISKDEPIFSNVLLIKDILLRNSIRGSEGFREK
jgi:hypothetical protein